MQQRLKQRLIGAVVLVALAVIFLPMLLTGPVEQQRVDVPIEIPPKPAVEATPEAPPPGFAEQPVPAAEQLAQAPRPVTDPVSVSESQPDHPQSSSRPEPGPEPAPPIASAENVSPVGDPVADAEEAAPAEASAPEPEPAEPAEEAVVASATGSWAVQVGAFRERGNAMDRRDTLRESGYPAYVDEATSGGEPLYRVRLGPMVERAEAEAMAGKVKKEEGIPVLVVSR